MSASSFPALQERSLRRQEEGEMWVHRMSVSEDDRSTLAQHSGVWMCHVTHMNKICVHSVGVHDEDQSLHLRSSRVCGCVMSRVWLSRDVHVIESRHTLIKYMHVYTQVYINM